MIYIYVLQLNKNKIYIAQSQKCINNICKFFYSINDNWINIYKICNILELIQTNNKNEIYNISKQYKKKIGISNVKVNTNI